MAIEEPKKSKIIIKCENETMALGVKYLIEDKSEIMRRKRIEVPMYSMQDDGLFILVADMRINEDFPDILIVYDCVLGERMDMWVYLLKALGDEYEVYDWKRQVGETPDRYLTEKFSKEIKVSDIEYEGYMNSDEIDILVQNHKPEMIDKMIEQCEDMYTQQIVRKMSMIRDKLVKKQAPIGTVWNTAASIAAMVLNRMKDLH